MSKLDVIRAWKDEQYRSSLKGLELGALPPNPAGMIDLSEVELGAVAGGTDGTMPTGCIPACTQNNCLSLGGVTDFESMTLCSILSLLALCMCFGEPA